MSTDKNTINRVINETATKEEALEVIDWFSTTVEGQQYLSDLLDRDAYLMENEPSEERSFTPCQSDRLFANIENEIRRNRRRKTLYKAAAVLIPLLLITGFGFYIIRQANLFSKINYAELYVPKGENARIFFQDGTEVFLNADTRIRYPDKFGLRKRDVYLEGEAYFNVVSNKKNRPFIVHSQGTETEVKGTSFNVNSYANSDKIQVVLDKGSVLFRVHKAGYPLQPGQKIEYHKSTGQTTLHNLSNSSNASLWKRDTLHFYDTPLVDVMKVLERRFNVQFNIHDPEVLDYSFTLTTRQPAIENVLNELQKISPVKFVINNDSIMVNLTKD